MGPGTVARDGVYVRQRTSWIAGFPVGNPRQPDRGQPVAHRRLASPLAEKPHSMHAAFNIDMAAAIFP
jgi:hypothetical protein